ncbi:MAG: lipid-A-disaccharide synthase [Methylacidiphilales bacterium]|nr:lipid-A-disaccharide synthase [Candidatus Methylacidiphilales bacterium]MDW8349726.1 lipid-A-disaccharide synthase [Verrucomicrobiae bacterium]
MMGINEEINSGGVNVFIVAGETSGDIIGAELIRALLSAHENMQITGCGGPHMRAAGQQQLIDLVKCAVVGLVEVIKHYPRLRSYFSATLNYIRKNRPDVIVLIDYPGFNIRLAQAIRKKWPRAKIVFYVSPQVWAWHASRAQVLARTVDLLISILPFEKEWYERHAPGLRVEWVGHPILDRLTIQYRRDICVKLVGLLPGSRKKELENHLPLLIDVANQMYVRDPSLRFIWVAPDEERHQYGLEIISPLRGNLPLTTIAGYSLTQLSRCEIALVASGTASLECACVGVPQIVFYQVNPITYWAAKKFVKIRYVSMVNVLANMPIITEFVGDRIDSRELANAALSLLQHPVKQKAMMDRVQEVVAKLGTPGVADRAAKLILELVDEAG